MAGRANADTWQRRFSRYLDPHSEPSRNDEGGLEYRAFCPLHEDPNTSKTPSASFNFERGVFHCFGQCGRGMTLGKVWELVKDDPENSNKVRTIGSAPSLRKKDDEGRAPTEQDVERFKRNLHERAGARMRSLIDKRGLTPDTIKRYDIGWDGSRYTIPVRDRSGELVNIRRYQMGATRYKVVSFSRGVGNTALYGIDALDHDEVLICEGEMDTLIARQYGFNSLTATTGAGKWVDEWTPMFVGKRVYIAYDNDRAGIDGARKLANKLVAGGVEKVHVVKLEVADKQDLTDYFVEQGFSAANLRALMERTPLFEPKTISRERRQDPVQKVKLGDTIRAELVEKPVEVIGTVAGKQDAPFALPRVLDLTCSTEWNPAKCGSCPMNEMYGGQHTTEIPPDDKLLLRLVAKNEAERRKETLKAHGIPPTCPDVELSPTAHWAVEELVVVPSVDDREANAANIRRQVFNVGTSATPVNAPVRLEGVSTDDPRTGVMVMQTWKCEETQTSLDTYRVTEEDLADLAVFQPADGQSAAEKLWEIAEDLGANVTRIFGRPELHIAYDLVFHSLLDFRFRRAQIGKGWLELLVMGDTRTGKSEAAQRLTQHYRAGTLTSCEGATLAGLVGGAQQVNSNWVITWGTIPLHDRRLVILDEVSGLKDKGVLEQMSEVRSSGRAKVTKIVSQETNARTRLIWISNPVDGRSIAEMPRGAIDAVEDLITTPEDIARFDFAMVAAKSDVKSSVINAARPPKVEHVYTSDLCSRLVLWAWSRGPRDVKWELGAERLVLRLAELIGSRYIPDPPLLQAENARVKLARMAVAIAARLFSHDGTGTKVYVTKEHVRTARRFLDRLYRMPNFGYADHSMKEIRSRQRALANRRACWNYLRSNDDVAEALKAVVNDKEFRTKDFVDLGGMHQDLASMAVAELLKMQMLRRHNRGYLRMQPELTDLVRRLQDRDFARVERELANDDS